MNAIAEMEANEVMAALAEAGIAAKKFPGKEGAVSIQVDADALGRAVDILRARGLPRERHATMGQVFKKEGLISSPLEERARYLFALSQELSATIAQIDGVISARVHVVLPERGSGLEAAVPPSAAVFVKYQRDYNIEQVTPQIKRLVTNSIPGLTADKVTAVLVPSEPKVTASAGQGGKVVGQALHQAGLTGNPLFGVVFGLAVTTLGLAGFLVWRIFAARTSSSAPASAGVQPAAAE